MANQNLSIIKISSNPNDAYIIYDEQARTLANSAQSTAQTAQSTAQTAKTTADSAKSIANSKLKTAVLNSSYDSDTKSLTLSLSTTTN